MNTISNYPRNIKKPKLISDYHINVGSFSDSYLNSDIDDTQGAIYVGSISGFGLVDVINDYNHNSIMFELKRYNDKSYYMNRISDVSR
jgi:hypothetical protein